MALLPTPARAWIRHRFTAGNRHDVHSPFVFALVNEVLRTRTPRSTTAGVEALRAELLNSKDLVEVMDLGAGSRRDNAPKRRVADIARTALKPRRQAEQLGRLAAYFKPNTVLELGTSLGITTLHLAQAAPWAEVHTIEGSPAIAAIASGHFRRMQASNIRMHTGSFTDQLPAVLGKMGRLDLAYIDGHHAAAPTLDYFGQCLAKAHDGSVFILDDIHWSDGMEEAWEAVKAHPRVTVTIDLFHHGLVFLRTGRQKQHFVLRY